MAAEPLPVHELVTVVVLTHNRCEEVMGTVRRLTRLPERPPIIVVDNGSSDGTAFRLARRYPQVEIIRFERNRGAAARNTGIRSAETPFVALCDDDSWWEAGSLPRAAAVLARHSRVAIVAGRVLVGPDEREDPTCRLMASSPLPPERGLPGKPILGFLAGAVVIRKEAFLRIGGFEPKFFLGGEEALVAIDLAAAGWSLIYLDEAVACHYPSSIRDAPQRCRLLLRNAVWLAWLRRPGPRAVSLTLRALRTAIRDIPSACGMAQALIGLPWALRHRRPIPANLEAALKLVESRHSR